MTGPTPADEPGEYITQAHEQSRAVAVSASSSDDQAFIDAVSRGETRRE